MKVDEHEQRNALFRKNCLLRRPALFLSGGGEWVRRLHTALVFTYFMRLHLICNFKTRGEKILISYRGFCINSHTKRSNSSKLVTKLYKPVEWTMHQLYSFTNLFVNYIIYLTKCWTSKKIVGESSEANIVCCLEIGWGCGLWNRVW